jgi:hypothetical protein
MHLEIFSGLLLTYLPNFNKINNVKLFTFLYINSQNQVCYQPNLHAHITIPVLNTLSNTLQ